MMQNDTECIVEYSEWCDINEIICLENMWRRRVCDLHKQTMRYIFDHRLPDDIVDMIASLSAPFMMTTSIARVIYNTHARQTKYVLSLKKIF